MSTKPIIVNLAELARAVAGVMLQQNVNQFVATRIVLVEREMTFGQGREIANLARALVDEALRRSPPELRGYIRRRQAWLKNASPFSHAAASHEALAQAEQ